VTALLHMQKLCVTAMYITVKKPATIILYNPPKFPVNIYSTVLLT